MQLPGKILPGRGDWYFKNDDIHDEHFVASFLIVQEPQVDLQ